MWGHGNPDQVQLKVELLFAEGLIDGSTFVTSYAVESPSFLLNPVFAEDENVGMIMSLDVAFRESWSYEVGQVSAIRFKTKEGIDLVIEVEIVD